MDKNNTKISYNEEARTKLKAGVDKVANIVKTTLGPQGKNVVIQRFTTTPNITKDGVTVAKSIKLADPDENQGAMLIKNIAQRTDDFCGDGTTTATVLAQALLAGGQKRIAGGYNNREICEDIKKAAEETKELLSKMSKPVNTQDEIENIASISANDKKLGKMISNVIEEVGKEGIITVEESQLNIETTTEVVKGVRFDRGYITPYMVNDGDKLTCELKDAHILITDKKISSQYDIVPIMDTVGKETGKNTLLIIAEDVDGEALATTVINHMKGGFHALAVKAPEFGERKKQVLEDIAILTGAKFIDTSAGMNLKDVTLEDLGTADKVISSKDNTTIVGGKGVEALIKERVTTLKKEIADTDSGFEKTKLQERLGSMTGGVGVIKVGAPTEIEMKEIKYRIEDAVSATKAALTDGIVAGGGTTLVSIHSKLEGIGIGYDIFKEAILEPIMQIADNAGKNKQEILIKVQEGLKEFPNFGYDALVGKYEEDMMNAKIVDPTKVVNTAIDSAVSIVTNLLNSAGLITDIVVAEKEGQMM